MKTNCPFSSGERRKPTGKSALRQPWSSPATLTAEAQRAIDLLQARRTALISAAVTGQIDVRGVAHAKPENHLVGTDEMVPRSRK